MTMTRQSRLVTHGIRNLDERDESNVLRVLRSQSQRVNVLVESKNERKRKGRDGGFHSS